MRLAFLDYDTLGFDIPTQQFEQFGEVLVYGFTKYDETIKRLQDIDIVITNKVIIDKNIMDNTNLKLICVAATGMNNIDLEHAKQKLLPVKNAMGYSTNSVVQLTFTYVLNFVQQFSYYTNYVSNGDWEKSHIFVNLDKPFYELSGKKWGIIGLGSIGENVAQIASAFGCEVSYYSTSGNNNSSKYKRVSLEDLLRDSDVITIHSPLNEQTKNLITYDRMALLKDKAIFVNLGRGGIINENDLVKIIDEKEIYVGLDVLSTEPISKESPLNKIRNKERILITPHIGWASIEARQRLIKIIYENIQKFVLEYK